MIQKELGNNNFFFTQSSGEYNLLIKSVSFL